MTEDKRGVSNGPAEGTNPSEMAPQEDGTKVPLTNDDCAEVSNKFKVIGIILEVVQWEGWSNERSGKTVNVLRRDHEGKDELGKYL